MGGMLSHPVTNKRSDHGEGLGLRYGLSSMQGWRSEMEDAHDVKLGLRYGLEDWCFFAVFDGHAGKRAAAFAAWNLLEYILRDSEFELATEDTPEHVHFEPDLENMSDPSRTGEAKPNDGPARSQESNDEMRDDPPVPESETSGVIAQSDHPKKIEESLTCSEQEKQPSQRTETPAKTTNDEKIDRKPPKFASFPELKQLEMVKGAIRSGFLKIDESMRASAQDMSGCTAVCTLISPTHLFIANCGDSRAVLFDGCIKFETEDHKPFKPKERRRIIGAGGSATQRINGTLAVSRALGDFEFKKDSLRGQCDQLVSPEPEVTVFPRTPKDRFLILACDGIWDVIETSPLCAFVEHKLLTEPSVEEVCSSVLDLCLNIGSRDNMSIIIVVFENGPKVDEKEVEKAKQHDQLLIEAAETVLTDFRGEDFSDFVMSFKTQVKSFSPFLPQGVYLESKYDLLRKVFDKNNIATDEKSQ